MMLKIEGCHIIIIEPNHHLGEALRNFLASNSQPKSIRVFSSCKELEVLDKNIPIPDIMIVDTMLLQGEEISMFRFFTYLHPGVISIAVSMHNGIPSLADIIRLGFKGYISKKNVYLQLIPVIQSTLHGKYHFNGHLDY